MSTRLNARTEWEIDAARRREVIATEFAERRLLRGADAEPEKVAGTASPGLRSTLRAVFSGPAEAVEDMPTKHAEPMKPAKREA